MKLLGTLLFSLITTSTFATHLIGGDITYRHLSGNDYEVNLTLYRDCSAIDFTASVTIMANSSCGSVVVSADSLAGSRGVVTANCANPSNTCNSGSDMGVHYLIYRDTMTLTACADWIIFYQECCLNMSLSTINNVSSTGATTFATLDNTSGTNSSPLWHEEPMTFACYNSNFWYNQGANTDPDGDSLVYELYTPLDSDAGMTPVTYVSPYNYVDFMSSAAPISINPASGYINYHMDMLQVGIMGIRVTEYRGGVPVATTARWTLVFPGFGPNAISEIDKLDLSIYPNPATDRVTINCTDMELIRIYDLTGALILDLPVQQDTRNIDCSQLNAGCYIAEVYSATGVGRKCIHIVR